MEQTPNARRLSDVDRNFAAQTLRTPLRWMNITAASPLLRGLISDGGTPFCRLPRAVAEAVNPQVAELYANASGGRLHILTDSRTLAVRVTLGRRLICSHMTYLGVAGLDVYRKDGGAWAFAGSLIPQDTAADSFEASVSLPGGMQELLVYLPLYAEVRSLELGLEDGCAVSPAAAPERRVVFYGSSITQGGCAPRPGVSYPAIVSRRLGISFTNLGFSAGARAEAPMLDYLCTLPMDALVFDYDHNAPDADALEQTHLPAYKLLRAKRPALPILLASAPLALPDAEWLRRSQIVLETYRYAKAHGDTRVGFVDGAAMYPPALRAECSVDGIHPNALGMRCMADAFEPPLRSLLQSI